MSFLKLQAIGNVGQSPRFSNVGEKEVGNFSVATSRKVKGEKQTTWVGVQCWNERVNDVIRQYVKKGGSVYVEGTPTVRQYKDRDGNLQVSIELDITFGQLILLAQPKDADDEEHESRSTRASREPAPRSRAGGAGRRESAPIDDDIPF